MINPSSEPGQEMTANCPIIASESKEKGAYQVLDMTSAYYNQADSVIRGYMLTDDRRTAVIRDEIALKEESTVYWFMHTTADIEITSSDTAILTIEGKKMQLKMACEGATAKLTQMDAVPLPTTISLDGEAVNTGGAQDCHYHGRQRRCCTVGSFDAGRGIFCTVAVYL